MFQARQSRRSFHLPLSLLDGWSVEWPSLSMVVAASLPLLHFLRWVGCALQIRRVQQVNPPCDSLLLTLRDMLVLNCQCSEMYRLRYPPSLRCDYAEDSLGLWLHDDHRWHQLFVPVLAWTSSGPPLARRRYLH